MALANYDPGVRYTGVDCHQADIMRVVTTKLGTSMMLVPVLPTVFQLGYRAFAEQGQTSFPTVTSVKRVPSLFCG